MALPAKDEGAADVQSDASQAQGDAALGGDLNGRDGGAEMLPPYEFVPVDFSDACNQSGATLTGKLDFAAQEGCKKIRGSVICPFCDGDGYEFLYAVEAIEEDFGIANVNDYLPDPLNDVGNLAYVGNGLNLVRLYGIRDFKRLSSLKVVGGELEIRQNPLVRTFKGLENLRYVGSLRLELMESLESFEGLERLERIAGDFKIQKTPGLDENEIQAFVKRVRVDGKIIVEN